MPRRGRGSRGTGTADATFADALLRSLPRAHFATDVRGRFVYGNERLEGLYGLAPGGFEGRRLADLHAPRERDRIRSALEKAAKDGLAEVECAALERDGRELHVLLALARLDREGEPLLTGLALDITERKGAERRLAESEAHLRKAQEVAILGSWSLDILRDELSWSNEVFRIFGVPPGTALTYESFLEYVHPDDRDHVNTSWQAALRGAPYDIEHRIVVNGRVKWVREKAELQRDAEGRPVQGVGVVQDITPRKTAQEEASRLRAELTHVNRISTLGQFAAALSHELNQPLAAILSNAQAALRFLANGTAGTEEIREILSDIVRDDRRARDVILKVRGMARKSGPAAGFGPLPMERLVEDVLRIAHGDFVVRDISIHRDFDPATPPVRGDAVQLRQVVLNLILNACEAMEDSDHRALRLRIRPGAPGSMELSVRDSGRGIEEENEGLLFQPFFTTKKEGMGMGLAITRSIVEEHGGRISACNNPDGPGATFLVTLPQWEGGHGR